MWQLKRIFVAALFIAVTSGAALAQVPVDPCSPYDPAKFPRWTAGNADKVFQIALIFANDYADPAFSAAGITTLTNAPIDARKLSGFLAARGYHVVCVLNSTRDDMIDALHRFSLSWDSSPGNQQGLVYFAGHGGEDGGGTFVIPGVLSAPPTVMSTLHVKTMVSILPQTGRYLNAPILIIDACRSPLGVADQGFAPFNDKTQSTISGSLPRHTVVYTTSRGETAGDGVPNQGGPFINALFANLNKQPWDADDPGLADAIQSISTTLGQGQVPTEPITNADRNAVPVLWQLGASAQDYDEAYYDLGVSLQDVKRDQRAGCAEIAGILGSLDPHASDWAPAAIAAYRKLQDTYNCTRQVPITNPHNPVLYAQAALVAEKFDLSGLAPNTQEAIRNGAFGLFVRVGEDVKSVALRGVNARKSIKQSGDNFDDAFYSIDCSRVGWCNSAKVRVVDSKGGAFQVDATAVEVAVPTIFVAPIDGPTGAILESGELKLMDFLHKLIKPSGNVENRRIDVSIVLNPQAKPEESRRYPGGALQKANQVLRAGQSLLGLDYLMGNVQFVKDSTERWEACRSRQVEGYCLLVEVVQDEGNGDGHP